MPRLIVLTLAMIVSLASVALAGSQFYNAWPPAAYDDARQVNVTEAEIGPDTNSDGIAYTEYWQDPWPCAPTSVGVDVDIDENSLRGDYFVMHWSYTHSAWVSSGPLTADYSVSGMSPTDFVGANGMGIRVLTAGTSDTVTCHSVTYTWACP